MQMDRRNKRNLRPLRVFRLPAAAGGAGRRFELADPARRSGLSPMALSLNNAPHQGSVPGSAPP
jgi:hypothetical protein